MMEVYTDVDIYLFMVIHGINSWDKFLGYVHGTWKNLGDFLGDFLFGIIGKTPDKTGATG